VKCLDCSSRLVPGHRWKRMSRAARARLSAAGVKPHHSQELCRACHYAREKDGRKPSTPRSTTTNCPICSAHLVRKTVWQRLGLQLRRRLSAAGMAQRELRDGTCTPCYHRGGKIRTNWKTEELIEEAEHLFSFGYSEHGICEKLGVTFSALEGAYYRGRKRGLTERRLRRPA
jgi:hypothetical protein